MPTTYYIQARKLGPVVTYQVTANNRAQALVNFVAAAGPGEEYQILDGQTLVGVSGATGVTSGTGPSGATFSP
jgi:hypothetical protein